MTAGRDLHFDCAAANSIPFRLCRSQQHPTSAKANNQQPTANRSIKETFSLIMLSGSEVYVKLKAAVLAVCCSHHPPGAGCSHHHTSSHLS